MYHAACRPLVLVLALCLAFAALVSPVLAQGTPPSAAPGQDARPGFAPDLLVPAGELSAGAPGNGHGAARPAGLATNAGLLPQTAGGPDVYGYTWNDGITYNWIDTTGGTTLALTGECNTAAAIPLPFPFKYYENVYDTIYAGYTGFLAFSQVTGCNYAAHVPSAGYPNGVIAPYFGDFADAAVQHVRYLAGGFAPNRYMAIEWNQMPDWYSSASIYTFEALLYENGDIVFQYQNMTLGSNWACAGTGIEDADGLDGLEYQWCNELHGGLAIRFTRPAPGVHVAVAPLNQGQFVHAGTSVDFPVTMRNTGELGTDTFDLIAVAGWPVTLYAADGVTPLTDTDADGALDTGPLTQGVSFNLVARVQIAAGVEPGAYDHAHLLVRSKLNPARNVTADLATAIPVPFVQAYRDVPDNAMSLALNQAGGQVARQASTDNHPGNEIAIAETPEGNFVYTWDLGRCLNQNCSLYAQDLEYTLLDRFGVVVRPQSKLTDNGAASYSTHDYATSLAVAPNGQIAVTWVREIDDASSNPTLRQFNVYFALLNPAGVPVYGPINLTNNTTWSTPSNLRRPQNPHVSATDDNRYVVAWQDYLWNGSQSQSNIYYAVRASNGSEVQAPTPLTYATFGSGDGYYYTFLTRLAGSRVLLTFERGNDYGDIYFAVLDSAGNIVKGLTNLSNDGASIWDWRTPAAAQLSNGRIMVAWCAEGSPQSVRYAVMDAAYNLVSGPFTLDNRFAPTGDDFISVIPDNSGRAALTWSDSDYHARSALYYALVNQAGTLLTPPMIFHHSSTAQVLATGWYGQAATTYSSIPAGDGVLLTGSTLAGARPGANAGMRLSVTNHGGTALGPGSNPATLSAQLAGGLTYAGDTLGTTPLISGNTVTWNLPDMAFLDSRQFTFWVAVPAGAAIGQRAHVALGLEVPGDSNMTDNTSAYDVMAAEAIYLPRVLR